MRRAARRRPLLRSVGVGSLCTHAGRSIKPVMLHRTLLARAAGAGAALPALPSLAQHRTASTAASNMYFGGLRRGMSRNAGRRPLRAATPQWQRPPAAAAAACRACRQRHTFAPLGLAHRSIPSAPAHPLLAACAVYVSEAREAATVERLERLARSTNGACLANLFVDAPVGPRNS